jgi:hypothetical protein
LAGVSRTARLMAEFLGVKYLRLPQW